MLGAFQCASGFLVVSDPCHEPGVWCAGTLPARPGKWLAAKLMAEDGAGPDGTPFLRVAALLAVHEDAAQGDFGSSSSFLRAISASFDAGFEVGVDSGQAGIFDSAGFPKCHGELYGRVCALTLSEGGQGGGIVEDFGAVCASGHGDGSYSCLIDANDGSATAVRLDFTKDDAP